MLCNQSQLVVDRTDEENRGKASEMRTEDKSRRTALGPRHPLRLPPIHETVLTNLFLPTLCERLGIQRSAPGLQQKFLEVRRLLRENPPIHANLFSSLAKSLCLMTLAMTRLATEKSRAKWVGWRLMRRIIRSHCRTRCHLLCLRCQGLHRQTPSLQRSTPALP